MKADLLDLLCCPKCRRELRSLHERAHITEGRLRCTACEATYDVINGIPHVYVEDAQWSSKAREITGWIDLVKEKGIYEQILHSEDSFKLPYLHDPNDPAFASDPWVITARFFEASLELMKLRGGETVLDIGAGQGWASKYFALKGCRAVATDILADDHVGLGRAYAIMEKAETSFDLVMGDTRCLPSRDRSLFQPKGRRLAPFRQEALTR